MMPAMPTQPLPPIARVGIVAKSHLRAATPHLADIADWLALRKIEAVFETATAALMSANGYATADKAAIASSVDMNRLWNPASSTRGARSTASR